MRAALVAPLQDDDAVLLANFSKRKHIIDVGEEALCQQIGLPGAPAVVHVGRKAQAL